MWICTLSEMDHYRTLHQYSRTEDCLPPSRIGVTCSRITLPRWAWGRFIADFQVWEITINCSVAIKAYAKSNTSKPSCWDCWGGFFLRMKSSRWLLSSSAYALCRLNEYIFFSWSEVLRRKDIIIGRYPWEIDQCPPDGSEVFIQRWSRKSLLLHTFLWIYGQCKHATLKVGTILAFFWHWPISFGFAHATCKTNPDSVPSLCLGLAWQPIKERLGLSEQVHLIWWECAGSSRLGLKSPNTLLHNWHKNLSSSINLTTHERGALLCLQVHQSILS